MSKKRAKSPSTSKKTLKKTEAPKLLTRDAAPAELAPPTMFDSLVVEAPMLVEAPLVEPSAVVDAPMPIVVERKQIARLAFQKFAQRGYVHGYHVEDWLAAEAELRGRA